MAEIKAKSLEDLGTRREHLIDLYETWQYGIAILSSASLQTEGVEKRKADLENAAKLLWHAFSTDYDARSYVTFIQSAYKPEEIEDVRGTPLKAEEHPEGYDKPSD